MRLIRSSPRTTSSARGAAAGTWQSRTQSSWRLLVSPHWRIDRANQRGTECVPSAPRPRGLPLIMFGPGDLPMINRERLRVGLVGCGNQGGALAQAIIRSDLLRLVACADEDDEAARRTAAQVEQASAHNSIEGLLNASDVDAVVIATPHHLLARHALVAIRLGKHAFVEKPMALDEAEAKEVEFAAASADVN